MRIASQRIQFGNHVSEPNRAEKIVPYEGKMTLGLMNDIYDQIDNGILTKEKALEKYPQLKPPSLQQQLKDTILSEKESIERRWDSAVSRFWDSVPGRLIRVPLLRF